MSVARYLEPHERQALLAELKSPRDRLLAVLGLNTGLRVGSILSLKWKELVWNGQPLPAFEVPPPPEGWVFASRKRWPGAITRQHAHALISEAAARAGLPPGVAPHSLRRSHAGDLFEASGHNLLLVQRALGHASVEVTATYLKVGQDEVDDLVRGLPFRTPNPVPSGPVAEVQTRISGA